MTEHAVRLQTPNESLRDEYLAFHAECVAASNTVLHGSGDNTTQDFERKVQAWHDHANGVNLPEGWIPYSTFWLVDNNNRILGITSLRHHLTAGLEHEGGHIGYTVRPSERNKGYATLMLKMMLDIARKKGIIRALLTCDEDNRASAAVIRKNDGILENEVISHTSGKTVQRYWIELNATTPQSSLKLQTPNESLRDEYLAFEAEFAAAGERDYHGFGCRVSLTFDEKLKAWHDYANGDNLPDGWLPATTYWLVDDANRLFGIINLRYELTPKFERESGHVGFSIRPSERHKGYATQMLTMGLDMARQAGLTRALIACYNDNSASAAVIRKNGGVLENEIICNDNGKIIQRYWVDLRR